MSLKIESPVEPIDHDTSKSSEQASYDRARRAISHFYRIRPNLEAFARVFTKNKDMRIEPTSGASATDGKGTIWLKVNIKLGDEYRHNREKCDKRDARLQLKCSACLARENMLVALFHEIAHNLYESFEVMSDTDKETAVEEALAEAERFGVSGRRLESIRTSMTDRPPATYAEAAHRISPYLFPLVNGLEDARINALTMRARKGMRPMFEARTLRIFGDGIETDDGRVIHWRDQPGNVQVVVAMSCFASGQFEYDWFSDDVADAIRDEELQRLVLSAVQTDSAAEVYRYGFPILEKLRSLGFCRAPEDEPIEEGDGVPDDEDTGGDHDESEEGDGDGSTGEEDGEPNGEDASTEPSDEPSGTDDTGDPTEPDEEYEDDGPSGAFEFDDPDDGDLDGEPDEGDGDEPDEGDSNTGAQSDTDDDDADSEYDDEPESGDGEGDEAVSLSGPGGDEQEVEDSDDDGGGSEGDAPPAQDGTPDEVAQALSALCTHGEVSEEQPEDDDIKTAIVQERDFDEPSRNVLGCNIIEYGERDEEGSTVFDLRSGSDMWRRDPMPENIIQQNLNKMRIAFSENRRGRKERNLRSGKVNSKVLGRRVPIEDERLFQKRTRPGKRDYFVVLGLDLSYSTASGAIREIKSAAFAQAELLDRIGVSFEVWGHTGSLSVVGGSESDYGRYLSCDLYKVKGADERWNAQTKERLEALTPGQANLDGHTMEFYRKRLDSSRATDKLMMYYTDGHMPAENGAEEKVILERELRECKKRGYEVVGVGVGTDSPKKYGMDTVIINSVRDVPEVVKELHKRLT